MHGNLSALDLERNPLAATFHEHFHLSSGTAFHMADHAVLREFHAGDDSAVHLQETVARLETDLLGRTARDDLQDNGSVIRDIELNTDSIEISGEIRLRFLQIHRRKIDGVRVKGSQGRHYSSIRNFLYINGIHIVFLYLLKNEIQFAPVRIITIQLVIRTSY